MKNAILFVHGFIGSKKEYQPIIKYLKKKGFNKFYEFCYLQNKGQVSIKEIAKELSGFISNNITEEKFDVIGISQGGIIFLTYLKYFKNKEVGKIFTLCSPHDGSLFAYFGKKPGFIDLRPKSNLLVDINQFVKNSNLEIFSVFTPFDLMVFPGWNARLNYGKIKMVLTPFHPLVFMCSTTKKFIYKNLINN
jgi:pimeloyl-ACP methyl ester carboxylesterase